MPNNVFSTALARNPYPFHSRSSRMRSHWLRAGIAKPLIVALCLIGVPGCSTWSVGPDFERPDMQNMPEKWDAGDPQHPLVGNVSLDTWWQRDVYKRQLARSMLIPVCPEETHL